MSLPRREIKKVATLHNRSPHIDNHPTIGTLLTRAIWISLGNTSSKRLSSDGFPK